MRAILHVHGHPVGLEYEDSGTGQPILFIHGYPLNRTLWEPQVNDLADTARVIAPDLRGHGQSDPVPGPYSVDLMADDCAALLDALGVTGRVVVCGLSMGGYVVFAFWRKYSERVAGLILSATRAGADSEQGRAGRDAAAAVAREKGAAAIAESMLPKMLAPSSYTSRPEVVARARRMMETTPVEGILGDLAALKDRPDSTPTLATITRPTLILHGANDGLIPPSEAEVMHAGIAGSTLTLAPDAGHLLNLEQPEAYNAAVRAFLKGIQP